MVSEENHTKKKKKSEAKDYFRRLFGSHAKTRLF